MDMKNRFGRLERTNIILLSALIGFVVGIALDRQIFFDAVPSGSIPSDAAPEFRLIAEAWNYVERNYVDRPAVQPRRMTYGAISGLVDSLGDTGHSTFLTPEMVQEERTFVEGAFAGIGIEVQMKDKQVVVVAPLDGSPAQRAGLQPGDIIIRVDGKDVAGQPLEQVVRRIQGPVGTKVTLTIRSPRTGQTKNVGLVRARITLRSVTWQMLPGTTTAHVRIAFFSQDTSKSLETSLADVKRRGGTAVILDLRNDPGGVLDAAVGVTSLFLKTGNVLIEKNAEGQMRAIPVEEKITKYDFPLAVLINGGTASAAEIVAGALQDARRGRLVGETTFGTGTVLKEFPLSDGSSLLLAVLEWLTPSGRAIWHHGITPDVVVPLPVASEQLLPEAERTMTAAQLRSSKDTQLRRALDLLAPEKGAKPS